MDEIEAISQYFRFFHFGPYTNVVHLDQNGIGDQERLEDATHYYIALGQILTVLGNQVDFIFIGSKSLGDTRRLQGLVRCSKISFAPNTGGLPGLLTRDLFLFNNPRLRGTK